MHKTLRLTLSVLAASLLLAGCGSDDQETPFKPVAFDKHDRCLVCGMVISHYEGPKAEVFIKGAEGEAVKFCSGRDAFSFALQPENARRLKAFFIHDMARADWAEPEDKYLIDATKAVYVVGSDTVGVMGPEPIAFSDPEKARVFSQKHGGKVIAYKAVTLEVLD